MFKKLLRKYLRLSPTQAEAVDAVVEEGVKKGAKVVLKEGVKAAKKLS